MATGTASNTTFTFPWILSKRRDLLFYIGSALVGWIYVAIVFFNLPAISRVASPTGYTLFSIGSFDLTLEWVIILSWGILFDAPHLFATLARTFFDGEERQVRRKELNKSWLFFVIGPVLILTPYLIGLVVPLSEFVLGLGAMIFLVAFRLWAYYHVVRQHWGFYNLYKRKNGDPSDKAQLINRVDYWFFQFSLYLPLIMFLTADYYLQIPSSAFPDIGLHADLGGGASIATIVNPIVSTLYFAAIIGYILFQFYFWRSEGSLNGSKLLYMALVVPLHFVAFSHPIIVLFLTPIVTVGHNIQYHQIVYEYGQTKYIRTESKDSWAKRIFSSFWIYAVFGLIFTFLLYRGPWIDWLGSTVSSNLNGLVLNSVGMMAGIRDYESLRLGELIFGAILLGWAMQHYYLDAKIWRVSKDAMVRRNLNLSD